MKIHPAPQHSLEWLTARAGVITASEFSEIVDTKFEPRTGEMPKTLLARKLAEKWLGGPLPNYASIDMDIGTILEEEARPFVALETGLDIQPVGLITSDDGKIGCSPDGIVGELGGVEIKCPRPETHIKYLLNGKVPNDYLAQVYGGLLVTERPWWKFASYSRHLPPLILHVEADEEIQDKLQEALDSFLSKLDAEFKRLCDMNGGPPYRKKSETVAEEEPQLEGMDVPH